MIIITLIFLVPLCHTNSVFLDVLSHTCRGQSKYWQQHQTQIQLRAESLHATAVLKPNWPQLSLLNKCNKVLLLFSSATLTKPRLSHWEKCQVENAVRARFLRAACPFCLRTTWFPTSSFSSGKWVLSSPRAGCAPTSLLLLTTKR